MNSPSNHLENYIISQLSNDEIGLEIAPSNPSAGEFLVLRVKCEVLDSLQGTQRQRRIDFLRQIIVEQRKYVSQSVPEPMEFREQDNALFLVFLRTEYETEMQQALKKFLLDFFADFQSQKMPEIKQKMSLETVQNMDEFLHFFQRHSDLLLRQKLAENEDFAWLFYKNSGILKNYKLPIQNLDALANLNAQVITAGLINPILVSYFCFFAERWLAPQGWQINYQEICKFLFQKLKISPLGIARTRQSGFLIDSQNSFLTHSGLQIIQNCPNSPAHCPALSLRVFERLVQICHQMLDCAGNTDILTQKYFGNLGKICTENNLFLRPQKH